MLLDTLDTFVARRVRAHPGASLATLCPVAYAVATCRAPAPVYADEPTRAAIGHRRESWLVLLRIRRARLAQAGVLAAFGGGDAA